VGDNKKVANSVVALSSAAVLAIYGAGYARTRAAADRFAQQAADRRPHIPAERDAVERVALDVAAQPPAAELPSVEADVDDVPVVNAGAKPGVAPPVAPKPDNTAQPTLPKPEVPVEAAAPPTVAAVPVAPADDEPAVAEPAAAPVPAPAPPPVVPPAQDPAKGAYKDGTFYGWGTSRHGDIQAAVVIESGRIAVARVERCLTRYSCNWITPIPPRILTKQATTYDYVSGATESSDAFQDAVAEALSQAK
jgi:uncharacterized protein with FMN-binding domain